MRTQRDGLVLWVGSSSSRGGTPPYLGPYFAAKAAEDALAVSYAASSPGLGSRRRSSCPARSHRAQTIYANAGRPVDERIATAYEAEYAGLMDEVGQRLAELAPDDADPAEVARQIVKAVDTPQGAGPLD